jgi:hypothetical protein
MIRLKLTPTTESLNTERDRRPKRLKAATIGVIELADMNRRRAFELRLPPHRLSYPAIARALGVSISTAYDYVNKEHGSLLQEIVEKRDQLRDLENQTIDALMEVFLPIALDPAQHGIEVSLRTVDRMTRLIEQKCRLNGLEVAPKVKTESEDRQDSLWRRELCDAMVRHKAKSSQDGNADAPVPKTSVSSPTLLQRTEHTFMVGRRRIRIRPQALPAPQPTIPDPPVPPPRPDIVILNGSSPHRT